MSSIHRRKSRLLSAVVLTQLCMFSALPGNAADAARFNISAGNAADSLSEFGVQSGLQLLFVKQAVQGYETRAVSGELEVREALSKLLEGTGLTFEFVNDRTVAIRGKDEPGAADTGASETESVRGIPEVFVTGARLLNMDVVRTRDDPQPYQILDNTVIERSNSVNVEDFLKRSLSSNAVSLSNGQVNVNAQGNASRINLRNLGLGSTLILINGRRAIGPSYFGDTLQAEVNTIPLAAIERIEVLPSAASAIYGGAALAGVVNVVLKQNYEGGDVRVRYENVFDGDAPIRAIDMAYGTSFEDGRTHVLIAGHLSEGDALVNADRPELMRRGVDRLLRSSPALLYSSTNPFHVGTTTNISSVSGGNLTLRDGTPLNAAFTHIPAGYNVGSNPAALVANAGTYNLTLNNTANYQKGLQRPLGVAPELQSLMAVARREMTDKLEVFSEFFRGVNSAKARFNPLLSNYVVPATAPTNPFREAVRVSIPDATQDNPYETKYTSRRAVLGFIYDLPGGWKAEADYTWNGVESEVYARYADMNNALATGLINPFVDTLAYPLDLTPVVTNQDGSPYYASKSYLHDVGLRFVGQIGELPAGRPVLTLGLGYREEGIKSGRSRSFTGMGTPYVDIIYFPQSQDIYSLYGEALVPLVSAKNRISGVHELDLQVAVRSERYGTDSGPRSASATAGVTPVYSSVDYTSTNTTIGLRWGIVDGLTLRASFSTAFLPPTYSQLLPGAQTSIATVSVVDPRRGNTTALARVLTGGNADLEPTETDNYNVGLVFEPSFLPGLRFSADWFRYDQSNVIVSPSAIEVVNNESLFPSRVTREPVAPGDPYGVGQISLIDQRLLNGTKARTSGVDFGLDYRFDTGAYGDFRFTSSATWFDEFLTQTTLGAPLRDRVNQVADNGPLKFKANASLAWSLRGWSAAWSTYYFGSYDQYAVGNNLYVLGQGGASVPSQMYHDLLVGYRFAEAGLLSDVDVQLGIKNVLDEVPPFDAYYSVTAFYSPFGDPRLRSYSLSIAKSF